MEDIDFIRDLSMNARLAMQNAPFEPFRGAKSVFPAGWCERASVAFLIILESRGISGWILVDARLEDDPAGHVWLERRNDSGDTLMSVDITLDQFREWDAPYIGPGESPARSKYVETRFEGPWREWPMASHDPSMRDYANLLLRYLAENS